MIVALSSFVLISAALTTRAGKPKSGEEFRA